jgi:hypothetical protein
LGDEVMKYSIRSDMMTDLTPKSPRILRYTRLCRLWRGVSWMLLPIAYAGALTAPAAIFSMPFQVFHKHHFPAWAFWTTAALVGLFVSWCFYRAFLCGWLLFRHRVIYLEAITICLALVFTVIVVIWLFPPV